ncbi:MAG: iron-sulfur cluster assembly scaffold protein [Thermodesulfobacteriota bacterium]|nr:iron-sulfur cluster assembly scaffold protein [Thermodesulfobacteriota bacterium]
MSDDHALDLHDTAAVQEILSGSGYSDKAIAYYLNRPNLGTLSDADQVSELTGPCGDTMKVYLKVDQGRIEDAKVQVLGCPGAVASAMVAMELAKGKTIKEAHAIKDRDIYRILEEVPDQKQHCIRLSIKALQKALEEYASGNGDHL